MCNGFSFKLALAREWVRLFVSRIVLRRFTHRVHACSARVCCAQPEMCEAVAFHGNIQRRKELPKDLSKSQTFVHLHLAECYRFVTIFVHWMLSIESWWLCAFSPFQLRSIRTKLQPIAEPKRQVMVPVKALQPKQLCCWCLAAAANDALPNSCQYHHTSAARGWVISSVRSTLPVIIENSIVCHNYYD